MQVSKCDTWRRWRTAMSNPTTKGTRRIHETAKKYHIQPHQKEQNLQAQETPLPSCTSNIICNAKGEDLWCFEVTSMS
jgi:hypothetical protein